MLSIMKSNISYNAANFVQFMTEVIKCTEILTRSPFAMSLDGFHGPTLELPTVSLITIVVCLCAVLQGTYNANKTRISSCCLS